MFKVLRPEYRVNRVWNASGNGAAGVSASQGSYSYDTSRAFYGRRCVKGTPSAGSVTLDYVCDALPATAQVMSVWASGAEPTAFIVGALTARPTRVESLGDWTRYELVVSGATASGQTAVKVRGNQALYVGHVQMEEGTARSTAIVGDMGPGYRWLGPAHGSASVRERWLNRQLVTSGGVECVLDDSERVIVGLAYGVGVPPVRAEKVSREIGDGEITLNRSFEPRALRFTIHLAERDFDALRALRAGLIDLLAPGQTVRLIWDVGGVTQYCDAAYVSGLELGEVIVGYEKLTLNMQADKSGWTASGQWSQALALADTFTAQHTSMRRRGQWQNMGTGPGATVRRLVDMPDGTVYCGTLSDGTYAYVAVWTGSTWQKLARVSGGSVEVNDVKRTLDGSTLYVVGSFTTIAKPDGSGSTSAANIATVNLSSGAVAAIGSGLNGRGRRMAWNSTGTVLYIVGDFSTAGGVSAAKVCALTVGGPTWAAMGTGLDGNGHAVIVRRDGTVVVGGEFSAAGASSQVVAGLTATQISGSIGLGYYALNDTRSKTRGYVVVAYNAGGTAIARSALYSPPAYWGGDALSWTAYGGASTYGVFMFSTYYGWAKLTQQAGTTYNSTTFPFTANWSGYDRTSPDTVTSANGSVQTPRIAVWNPVGSTWAALGQTGFSGTVYTLWLDPDGMTVLAGGQFGTADGNIANGVAWYNGSIWRGLGLGTGSATAIVYSLRRFADGSIWAAGDATSYGGDAQAQIVGRWIGSLHSGGWVHTDLKLPGGTTGYSILENNGDVLLGHSANGTASRGALTTVNWPGTMVGYPRLVVTGPGTLWGFGSREMAADCYLDGYAVAAGETVTVDLAVEVKTITSSSAAALDYAVRPGSELGDVSVPPGESGLWLMVLDTSGASDARLIGYPDYLSVDA